MGSNMRIRKIYNNLPVFTEQHLKPAFHMCLCATLAVKLTLVKTGKNYVNCYETG